MYCKICKKNTKTKNVVSRSNVKRKIYICSSCDYEFFTHNPNRKLSLNKLDISRLKKAGLRIPKKSEQFDNGVKQSKKYFHEYLNSNDKTKKILEVGCSLGYFLFTLKKFGFKKIYGLEINNDHKKYVQKKLKIKCETDLKNYESKKLLFDKIFLFYSFEYIVDPSDYLKRLVALLSKKGEIIMITPNKNDVLRNILLLKSYQNFFYEDNSINYFSIKSLINILKQLPSTKFKIYTKQGYSLINLFNWFLNNKPSKSNFVGEDIFFDNFLSQLNEKKRNFRDNKISKDLYNFLKKTDFIYKKKINNNNLGNQIVLKIKKNA